MYTSQKRSTPRLDKINQVSLRDQVVSAIRDAIIKGNFRPGEKIPEQELATQLGVSRTPIREAIRILEQQGLLETRPKNGTYVAIISWDEVRDSLYVRMNMEEFAVRQALERLSPKQWAEVCARLQSLLDGLREAIANDDPVHANDIDVEWHTLLIDSAQNSYLSRVWRVTGLHFLVWSPERELYPFTPERWQTFFQRHEELLAGLRSGDNEQCMQAVRAHIFGKLSDINEKLSQPDQPKGSD